MREVARSIFLDTHRRSECRKIYTCYIIDQQFISLVFCRRVERTIVSSEAKHRVDSAPCIEDR